jgi:hypothetical protein
MSKSKRNPGIVKCWNDGIMPEKQKHFFINPLFQCSIIPFSLLPFEL